MLRVTANSCHKFHVDQWKVTAFLVRKGEFHARFSTYKNGVIPISARRSDSPFATGIYVDHLPRFEVALFCITQRRRSFRLSPFHGVADWALVIDVLSQKFGRKRQSFDLVISLELYESTEVNVAKLCMQLLHFCRRILAQNLTAHFCWNTLLSRRFWSSCCRWLALALDFRVGRTLFHHRWVRFLLHFAAPPFPETKLYTLLKTKIQASDRHDLSTHLTLQGWRVLKPTVVDSWIEIENFRRVNLGILEIGRVARHQEETCLLFFDKWNKPFTSKENQAWIAVK